VCNASDLSVVNKVAPRSFGVYGMRGGPDYPGICTICCGKLVGVGNVQKFVIQCKVDLLKWGVFYITVYDDDSYVL
jgi:hypothetical protein